MDNRRSESAELIGRKEERARIDALLDGARLGHTGALVVTGEPGIGKSAAALRDRPCRRNGGAEGNRRRIRIGVSIRGAPRRRWDRVEPTEERAEKVGQTRKGELGLRPDATRPLRGHVLGQTAAREPARTVFSLST